MLVTLSVRKVQGLTKDEREDITYYERFLECEFSQLANLLTKDYIYSPWNYLGYKQLTTNICSESQFVVIDVDSTSTLIHQRLEELIHEELQCIIGTTSDPDNLFKYRILLPLDRSVTAYEYRLLVQGLQVNGLITDMDPVSSRPAQKFYAYANSLVVFDLTGKPLAVDDYILDPTTPESRALDPTADVSEILHEFNSYRTAIKGSRTKCLLHAAYRCLDLGLTDSQLERVVMYVNSTFLIPKSIDEIHRRVLNFIKTQRK